MAQSADDIRHEIADTRAAMTAKLALLEARVLETVAGVPASVEKIVQEVGGIVQDIRGTVEDVEGTVKDVRATVDTTLGAVRQGVAGTQATVEEIVEYVKGTIGETVTTVKRTFDLPLQVEQHPWPMVGGALLAGYLLGRWGGGRPSVASSPRDSPGVEASSPGSPPALRASSTRLQPPPGIVSGILDQVKDAMQDEMVSLTRVAVGAVVHTLRQMFKQAMPTLAPSLEKAPTQQDGNHCVSSTTDEGL